MKGSNRGRLGLILSAFSLSLFLWVYAQVDLKVIALRASATAAQIIIDAENPTATEVTVNEGNTIQLKPQVRDSAGNVIENAPLAYNSISLDIATVDAAGKIQGNKAGFSTLTVSSGAVVATATITVVSITSGVSGFTISGVAQDLGRRLYLANTQSHTILFTEDLQKTPSVYAGVNQVSGLINDERLKSQFNSPSFLAIDQSEGSLYVSDSANNVIRKIRPGPAGQAQTLAGAGQPGSQDGPVGQAMFNNPQGVALDDRGFLWVADSGNHTIRRINLFDKTVQTIAGKAGVTGSADGAAAEARFNSPVGLAVETGTLAQQLLRQTTGAPPPPVSVIVADRGNGLIRRVKETGQVETVATISTKTNSFSHSPTPPFSRSHAPPISDSPSASRAATAAMFNSPTGVAVDPSGNIYVSETGSGSVKAILQKGIVVAAAQAKTFAEPRGIAISATGQVVVADSNTSARQIAYGQPKLTSVTPGKIDNRGGAKVTIRGQNFAPDTSVVLSGVVISGVQITDTQTITFIAPVLGSGLTTLTVQNRGGLVQTSFQVDSIPLSELPAGYITTVAGGSTFSGDGGLAFSATLAGPLGLALDSGGNLYIADTSNHRIRKVDTRTGIITTVAGTGQFGFSGDNGPATAAALYSPRGPALDSAGNLYISDGGNNRIRRVDARTGMITTVAGTGQSGFAGDNGSATAAALYFPQGVALDSAGNLYIADFLNNRIRKVDARTGIITTAAGSGQQGFAGDNGLATAATLANPVGLAFDSPGNLYIADAQNYRIRKVDTQTGIITTVAGAGRTGFTGDDVLATESVLFFPTGVALDSAGNLYIADYGNHRIRKVDARTGIITTVAGTTQAGVAGDNGPATAAALNSPAGLALDSAGNLYIADANNNRIRKVDAGAGIITTVTGTGQGGLVGDNGSATAAALNFPQGLAFDSAGNPYIADFLNNRIRKVDARTGIIATVAGTGQPGFAGDNGPAGESALNFPRGLAFDSAGNLYIADTYNHRIRKVDARSGVITTVAGTGQAGFAGDSGPATVAALYLPQSLALDSAGNLYIADTYNHRTRKVDAQTGTITTVAGTGQAGLAGDNGPATVAALYFPTGLALDSAGNLYIADTFNNRIRKVEARTGIITTVAGTGQIGFAGDNGPATAATLYYPEGVALDSKGTVYIADSYNSRIRKVDPRGVITTVAGTGQPGFANDNGPATAAALFGPQALALDSTGNLYIADTFNNRIRAVRGPIDSSNVPPRPRRRP